MTKDIDFYIDACIGYLINFKKNKEHENELAKAEFAIKRINEKLED
jgi:hypothetical protein